MRMYVWERGRMGDVYNKKNCFNKTETDIKIFEIYDEY